MIKFSNDETEILTRKIQLYFNDELDQELGQFPARFLLDFFSEEIGVYFYNRGLQDAQLMLESRIESVGEAILDLEKATEFTR
ncbi:MAG: DUF2164 domain-containing protein [Granulosicoccus sp.]